MPRTIELFFIGDEFYGLTGSSMSSIYEVGTYRRWDWGLVSRAVREGNTVTIRPAYESEMDWAINELTPELRLERREWLAYRDGKGRET